MKKRIIRGLAAVMIVSSMLITACGEKKPQEPSGFTQSLINEQKKADEALETFEKASEALDRAAEQASSATEASE